MIILSCWDHSWSLKRKAIPHFKRILLCEWMDESRNISCKNEQFISSLESIQRPEDILGAPHQSRWYQFDLKPSRYQHRRTILMFWQSLVPVSVLFCLLKGQSLTLHQSWSPASLIMKFTILVSHPDTVYVFITSSHDLLSPVCPDEPPGSAGVLSAPGRSGSGWGLCRWAGVPQTEHTR